VIIIRRGSVAEAKTHHFGELPAILLVNPKYPHNVGAVLRACSCYGIKQLWFTGSRVQILDTTERLPREERMRDYADVELIHADKFTNSFDSVVPVSVEVRENSENLVNFIHPKNALYIFGPEDGFIPRGILALSHRFLKIPTKHCLNLSAAVHTVLYDRFAKESLNVA
jgi:tRNA(Leu) C34 or U34 (ribose-2'-O)-methylase TrmL